MGDSDQHLWGLPLKTWQGRAYNKVGANKVDYPITADIHWVLSANLHRALFDSPMTALIADNHIIAVTGLEPEHAQTLIGQAPQKAEAAGLSVKTPDDLSGDYIKALRKKEKPYALNIKTTPVSEITRRQFASSYKGITDFVTRFIWPLPAYYVTRLCAALRITPNMVTTLSLIMVFLALYCFWNGQWVLGFVTGWFMTFLDTVDGKLARTTMTYSKWGNIYDHGIDLIHPPFWYIAWFVGLGGVWQGPSLLKMALIAILIGYGIDRLIEGIFMRRFGFHIHVWKPFNSFLRFIIARRNPNMFIFMIGIILSAFIPGAGQTAFGLVALWVWFCIGSNIISLCLAMLSKESVRSWMDEPAG